MRPWIPTVTQQREGLFSFFVQEFLEINQAIAFEKQVKGWSRKKKLAIINNEWDKLKDLAECKNKSSHKNYNGSSQSIKP